MFKYTFEVLVAKTDHTWYLHTIVWHRAEVFEESDAELEDWAITNAGIELDAAGAEDVALLAVYSFREGEETENNENTSLDLSTPSDEPAESR